MDNGTTAPAPGPLTGASRLRRPVLVLAGLVILLDLATKEVMLALIFDPPRRIEILPFLNFAPVWNPGISFGMLADGGVIMRYALTGLPPRRCWRWWLHRLCWLLCCLPQRSV